MRAFHFLFFCIIISLLLVSSAQSGQQPFQRIISLYGAHSENLLALGAKEQLIGISSFAHCPARLADLPRFSHREDAEKFIGARPDLVLVRPMIVRAYPQLLEKLEQAGIKVVSLQPTSMTDIFAYWRALGELTGRKKQAERMIKRFQEQLAVMADKVADIPQEQRPRVYFEAIHKKMKTFAPQSIAIFVLEQAGGVNVATDARQVRRTNIAAYGKEKILAKAEMIDVFIAQQGRMNPVSRQTIINEPGFGAIKAVREGRVYLVNEALVSRPTMAILDGIRAIHTILYGEAR